MSIESAWRRRPFKTLEAHLHTRELHCEALTLPRGEATDVPGRLKAAEAIVGHLFASSRSSSSMSCSPGVPELIAKEVEGRAQEIEDHVQLVMLSAPGTQLPLVDQELRPKRMILVVSP